MKKTFLIPSLSDPRDSPRVRLLVLVEERLQALILLELAELRWIGEAEERRRKLDQPLRVDRRHFPHVLLRCLNQLVVNDPKKVKCKI